MTITITPQGVAFAVIAVLAAVLLVYLILLLKNVKSIEKFGETRIKTITFCLLLPMKEIFKKQF